MDRRAWRRDELILAFNSYCRIPFGRLHRLNPEIIELANILGRTPSAVAWKLSNFARLDPELRKRGIRGASHGSKAEHEIWAEFNDNWEVLAVESHRLLSELKHISFDLEEIDIFPSGGNRLGVVNIRINQSFFRSAVLAAYECRCCITGLSIPELLTASHIVPWAADNKNRTNPRNGLALNALHDRAFDCGLITVTPDYRIHISTIILSSKDPVESSLFRAYDGTKIRMATRFLPKTEFLQYHNDCIFRG